MTKKEFEEKSCYRVSQERYDEIEKMYILCGDDICKDLFCDDYSQHRDSILLNRFFNQVVELTEEKKSRESNDLALGQFLVDESVTYRSQLKTNYVISLIGEKEYIQYKLDQKLDLSDFDRELIISLIK